MNTQFHQTGKTTDIFFLWQPNIMVCIRKYYILTPHSYSSSLALPHERKDSHLTMPNSIRREHL